MSANRHNDPDDTAPCRTCEISELREAAERAQRQLRTTIEAWCGPDHQPVQHRDGLPPWCKRCKYRVDGWPVG